MFDEAIKEIRENIEKVPGVLETEKCFVRKSGIHFNVNELYSRLPEIFDVLIHVEPEAAHSITTEACMPESLFR